MVTELLYIMPRLLVNNDQAQLQAGYSPHQGKRPGAQCDLGRAQQKLQGSCHAVPRHHKLPEKLRDRVRRRCLRPSSLS